MAAGGRIRGITLEIGGDTTGLANALKGVNSQIKGTQTTLNDVNRLLKLDPTNTELLSQKQKLLSQAVESTKEKLQTLKQASEEAAKSAGNYDAWKEKYEPLKQQIEETSATLKDLRQKAADAKEQFEGGKISESQYKAIQQELAETSVKLKDLKDQKKALDEEFGNPISPEQYDALQREIVQTEQDLRKLEDAADDTGDEMEDLDKSADKVGISLGDMVKNKLVDLAGDALRNIGQKAVEAAKYIVGVGSSFGSAMSEVRAISGASAGDMDRLTAKAKEMGATTKFSATESADAFSYMAMAGWKTEEMLSGIEGVMDLAAASGEDLATTSDIVTDALTAFGESADQSGRLADIMAAASSNANTNVSMMGETFKYAAPVAGALGYSMEDTAVAIGLMANAGIKASQAGTSIRSGLTRLAAPTKQVAEAMDQYGISLTDADGKMLTFREMMIQLREKLGGLSEVEQTAAASALFGKNAMSGWLAVINGSDADFDKLTSAIDNSNGAADEMSRIMQDNLTGKVKLLDAALEGLGIAVYEYVSGPLQNVVEFVTGIISGLTGVISPQRTELEKFIDDIQRTNDEIERSLDHAQKTIDDGDAKAAEIEAYKGMLDGILDSCEQFNLVTLDTGEQAIVDSSGNVVKSFKEIDTSAQTADDILDQWAADGFNTAGIEESSTEAQNQIGYIKTEADTVEERLKGFAESGINTEGLETSRDAIVQIFGEDEGGIKHELIGYKTKIDELGNVTIDTTGIEEPVSATVTVFEEASGKVKTFSTDLESLNGSQVNLSQIATQFTEVEDSVKRTYVITDEFTKAKINHMVETLGDSVEGLADAWNAQTGELTASRDELEKWFDTAKEIAVYEALEKALKEMYDAWGEAAVNVAKADSAVSAALKSVNEELGASFETAQEAFDWLNSEEGKNAWSDYAVELNAAVDAQNEANAVMTEAEEAVNTTGESLSKMRDKVGDLLKPTEEAGKTAEEAADAVGELGDGSEEAAEQVEKLTEKQQEAIDRLKEFYQATDEDLEAVREKLGKNSSDFADWAEDIMGSIDKVKDEYTDLYDKVNSSIQGMLNGWEKAGETQEEQVSSFIESLWTQREELNTWVESMKALGEMVNTGEFSQKLYDELLQAGAKGNAGLVAGLAGDPESAKLASQYFTDNIVIASEDTETLMRYSAIGKQWGGMTANGTVEGLNAMADAFLASGMTEAEKVGEGISAGTQAVIDEASGLVTEATDSATAEAENANTTGETMATSTKEGIESTKQEVTAATEGMITDARDAGEVIASEFHRIGQIIPQKVKQGINEAQNMGLGPTSAIEGMMEDVLTAINAVIPDVEAAAQNMLDAFTKATSDFSWTLPTPQLPHIKWDWERITYGNGGWFEIPNFSVDWYAKAMEKGMILDTPTIFGAMNGKLLAGGEAGQEAVVGTRSLMGMIQQAVSQAASVNNFGGVTVNVYGHEGQDIRQLADEIEYRIALNVKRKEAGFA